MAVTAEELVEGVKLLAEKVQAATILRLQPGDTLVLKCPMQFENQACRQHLQTSMRALFPDHECVVLEEGLDLEVVRPE